VEQVSKAAKVDQRATWFKGVKGAHGRGKALLKEEEEGLYHGTLARSVLTEEEGYVVKRNDCLFAKGGESSQSEPVNVHALHPSQTHAEGRLQRMLDPLSRA
jgi:methyl coenzyme M reductase gamma subunit